MMGRSIVVLLSLVFASISKIKAAPMAPMPVGRFENWEETSISNRKREALGYTEATWNTLFSLPLEETAWFYINQEDPQMGSNVLDLMSESQWDCKLSRSATSMRNLAIKPM